MRRKFIQILGGFNTVEEALDSIGSKEDKHTILTKAVSDLFNTIGENEILKVKDGIWFCEGKELTKEEAQQIKAEAQAFLKTRLYTLLNAEVKYHAAYKMYYKSQTVDDLMAGKMIEYVWDIIKTKLKKLR